VRTKAFFFGEGDDGVRELRRGRCGMVGIGAEQHQDASDDGEDQNGEQFLTNPVLGPAMEGLDVEGSLLVAVMCSDCPVGWSR